MREIQSESKFILRLLLDILLIPVTLIQILMKKKTWRDLLKPMKDISNFITQPKFTLFMIILTTAVTIFTWFFVSDKFFEILINYPNDLFNTSRWFSFITAGFLHADVMHLVSNMIGLFIFGRIVEKKIGALKTALFYFLAMAIGSVGQSLFGIIIGNNIGGIGASGAVMGMTGLALLLHPFYITYDFLIPLPVVVVGWLYVLGDVFGVFNPTSNIGHFAHLFGFFSVTILYYLSSKKEKRKNLRKGLIINAITAIILFIILL